MSTSFFGIGLLIGLVDVMQGLLDEVRGRHGFLDQLDGSAEEVLVLKRRGRGRWGDEALAYLPAGCSLGLLRLGTAQMLEQEVTAQAFGDEAALTKVLDGFPLLRGVVGGPGLDVVKEWPQVLAEVAVEEVGLEPPRRRLRWLEQVLHGRQRRQPREVLFGE